MKNKTLAISLVGLFVLYCLLMAVLVPIIAKPIISEQARNFIHGNVQVEDIDINPLTNSISIFGLVVSNEEDKTLISLDHAFIDLDILSIVALQVNVEILELDGLQIFTPGSRLLHLPNLVVNDTAVRLFSNSVTIENAALNNLKLSPSLGKNGGNVDELLAEVDRLLIVEETESPNENETVNLETEESDSDDKPDQQAEQSEVISEAAEETSTETTQADSSTNSPEAQTEMQAGNQAESKAPEDQAENPTEEIADSSVDNESSDDESPWLLTINQFAINQASIELSDSMNSEEALITEINDINLNTQNIVIDFSQDLQFKLSLKALDSEINLSGTANPISMNNSIKYDLGQINLVAANNYVELYSHASINSGLLHSSGLIETSRVSAEESKEPVLSVKITNNTNLVDLNIAHKNFKQPLIACPLIESNNLEFKLPENSISLESFLLDQCKVTVVMRKNGTSNTDLVIESTEKQEEKTDKTKKEENKKSTAESNMQIAVQSIKLTNNQVIIRDFTQGDEVNLAIAPINAAITNLSAGDKFLTKVSLDAKINKHAPLSIKGKGNFLNPKLSSDIQTKLDNMGLTVFSPYTLNLSSRPLEKGTLTLDIDVKIDENKLDSQNHALLAGFQLGKKQEHEGASKLPIALAVAVLRDNDGNINVDIPVSGDLDDPSFSVAKQVIKVITNLITKAATAAFSMLGDAVSGENNTNSKEIIFVDNTSTLSDEQTKTVQALATTLKAHQELALNIKSFVGQVEASLLTPEQQLTLQNQRINSFKQTIIKLGALEQQIVFEQDLSTVETSTQGKLELSFFAF